LKRLVKLDIVEPLREKAASGIPEQRPLFIFCIYLTPRKQEIGTMENKPAQNIQDTFLNTVRKDKTPITVYLVSGVKLTGKIRSFDKYSVLLENNNQEQLIFKHAISTVVSNKSVLHGDYHPAVGVAPVAATAAAPVAPPAAGEKN
jgi:host factor-I protein